jgi:hypothetical protein
VPQSLEVLKQKIIEKYGEPTEVVGQTMIYHTEYTMDRIRADFCSAAESVSCWNGMVNGSKYKTGMKLEPLMKPKAKVPYFLCSSALHKPKMRSQRYTRERVPPAMTVRQM